MKIEKEITEVKKLLVKIQEQVALDKAYLKRLLDEKDERIANKFLSEHPLSKEKEA